jgi:cytoskeletal protein CcmA (bactofilin family)
MSVIEQGLVVVGDIVGEDHVTVRGVVKGSIFLQKGAVHVEQTGHVEGEILAENVMVDGEIIGNITALSSLRVAQSSRIHGNLRGAKIAIEEGASFSGAMDIREPEPVELNIQDFKALSEEDYEKLRRWRVRNHLK